MSSRNKSLNLTLKMNGVEVENTLDAVKGRMYRLRASVNRLEEGTKNWIDQNKKLGAVTNEYKRMISAQKELGDNIEKSNKSILSQVGRFVGMAAGFSGIFSIVTGGIRKFSQFASGAVDLAREAKGVEYAFERMGEMGEKAFHKIKEATRGTLSDLDIKKAMVEFDTFNISQEHTADLFEFLTVRTTQTGKSIEYLLSSLVEGLSKESKLRIDNLGISAAELNEQLEKTPDFVEAVAIIAKREIGKAGAILDEAANANNKWNAQLQNTQLWLGNLMENSGGGSFFKEMATNILALVTPAGDLSDAFKQQAQTVIDLQKNINPLINEYEDLKGKSELSKDEQGRLKDVIDQIADAIPSAITAFDEYGNALDISADKARDFVQAQQAVLAVKNQDAIEQQTAALKTYEAQLRSLTNQINNLDKDGDIIKDVTTGHGMDKISYEQKLSEDEIRILQAKLDKIKQMEMGAKLYIEELSGDYLEKIVKKEEEQTARTLDEARKRADMLGLEYGPEATASEIEAMIKKWEALAGERKKLSEAAYKKAVQEEERRLADIQKLQDEYDKKVTERVEGDDKVMTAEREKAEALAKAEALRVSHALIEQMTAEHDMRIYEAKKAREEKEIQELAEFEERKKELLDELELAKAETEAQKEEILKEQELEKEEALYEKELERFEAEMERLKLNEEEKTELLVSLQELRDKKLDVIREKYFKKDSERSKKALDEKIHTYEASVDAAISAAGAESDVGKALLAVKRVFAMAEIAMKLGMFESQVALDTAGAISSTASGAAQTASVGFPQNIPLLIGFFAQMAGIIGGFSKAKKAASGAKRAKFARGGFTDNDGLGYRDETGHEVAGDVHVNEYVVPEIVRRDPEVPQILDYLEGKRKKKLGLYADGGDTGPGTGTPASSSDSEMKAILGLLAQRLGEPIIAHTLYDVEAAMARQEVDKKLSKIQKETKIKQD